MIIYRPHGNGIFDDAMKLVKEFQDENEMKDYIVKEWDGPFTKDDIIISQGTIPDSRNGWIDTRHVCIKRFNDADFIEMYGQPQCIGYCATDYPKDNYQFDSN